MEGGCGRPLDSFRLPVVGYHMQGPSSLYLNFSGLNNFHLHPLIRNKDTFIDQLENIKSRPTSPVEF